MQRERVAVGLLMTPVGPKRDLLPANLDVEGDDFRQAGKEEAGAIAKADGAAEVASFLAKAGLTQHFVTCTLLNNDVLTMKSLESMRKPDVKKLGLNIGEAATLMKRLANHKAQV